MSDVNPAERGDRPDRGRRRRHLLAVGLLAVGLEASVLRARGYGLGGNVVVRCRAGHLFTTLWLPGASLKALRFGPWRVQRCPVGHHFDLVTPVRRSALSAEETAAAAAVHDIRIP